MKKLSTVLLSISLLSALVTDAAEPVQCVILDGPELSLLTISKAAGDYDASGMVSDGILEQENLW